MNHPLPFDRKQCETKAGASARWVARRKALSWRLSLASLVIPSKDLEKGLRLWVDALGFSVSSEMRNGHSNRRSWPFETRLPADDRGRARGNEDPMKQRRNMYGPPPNCKKNRFDENSLRKCIRPLSGE